MAGVREAGAVPEVGRGARLRAQSTRQLVTELAHKGRELARKEVALVKTEVREDLRAEVKMASGLGVAGVCALLTLQLLLTAAAFAAQEGGLVSGWLASLILAAIVLAIGTVAGLVGWSRRVRTPLEATRRSVRESVRFVKERV